MIDQIMANHYQQLETLTRIERQITELQQKLIMTTVYPSQGVASYQVRGSLAAIPDPTARIAISVTSRQTIQQRDIAGKIKALQGLQQQINDEAERVGAAILTLCDDDYNTVVMRWCERLSYQQIADRIGIRYGEARWRVRCVRLALENILQ